QSPAPAEAITLRFQSIETFRTRRVAKCVVTNASRQNFTLSVFAEHTTNGAFALVSQAYNFVDVLNAGSSDFVIADLPPATGQCRVVVEYQVAPRTKLGKMIEPIRIRLFGERPSRRSYSEEFRTPP